MAELVLAKERCCQELVECAAVSAEKTLSNELCHWEAAESSATLAETALAKEQRCSLMAEVASAEYNAQTKASWDAAAVEAAKYATMLVVTALAELKATPKLRYGGPPLTRFSPWLTAAEVAELDAAIIDKQHCNKTAVWEKALANNANEQHCNKANNQCCHKSATREKALANNACKQLCRESAKHTAALAKSALAVEQTAILADLALPKLALAKDKRRQEETAKKQYHADDKRVMAPVLLPYPVNPTIRCIQVECALLAASLDAILAKIERNNIAHLAQALLTTTSPHPVAMLSTPPCSMTYVGRVLSTMGGSTRATSLALAPSSIPLPIVDGQLQTVRLCSQADHCTGCCYCPCMPSPPDEVLAPTHTQCWGGFLCQLRPLPR